MQMTGIASWTSVGPDLYHGCVKCQAWAENDDAVIDNEVDINSLISDTRK